VLAPQERAGEDLRDQSHAIDEELGPGLLRPRRAERKGTEELTTGHDREERHGLDAKRAQRLEIDDPFGRDVLLGGLMTSLLFNAGKALVGLYLGKTNLASTYGAAGSLAVCLFWVYYSTLVFFLGAEFTQVFANRYGSGPTLRVRRVLLGNLRKVPADSNLLR